MVAKAFMAAKAFTVAAGAFMVAAVEDLTVAAGAAAIAET
jgi:hypothetical protein